MTCIPRWESFEETKLRYPETFVLFFSPERHVREREMESKKIERENATEEVERVREERQREGDYARVRWSNKCFGTKIEF